MRATFSEEAPPPRPQTSAEETPVGLPAGEEARRSSAWRWELGLYVLLMVGAAVFRYWDLGARPIHFDESLRATFTWRLAQGLGYTHDPELHGPLFFYLTSIIFRIFGASEFYLRVLPAALGTMAVGMPYFLRGYLGRRGALLAALLLAVSPVMVYFSRFGRMDIYMVVWNLALVICLWAYLREGKKRYLFLSALFLVLAFTTKELAYVQVAVMGSFVFWLTLADLWKRQGRWREVLREYRPASYLVFLVALLLPLTAPLVNVPVRLAGENLQQHVYVAGGIVILFFVIGAAIGLRWNVRIWLPSAVLFYFVYALLFTSLFTHFNGLATGIWGSLDYWAGRELAKQPWYYHLTVLGIYEFVPLLVGIAASVYYAVKGPLFGRFLAYWFAVALVIHSLWGIKMPWHSPHLVLPLILLSGKFVSDVLLPRLSWKTVRGWGYAGLAVVLAGLLVLSVRTAWRASFPNQNSPVEMLVYSQGTPMLVTAAQAIDALAQETGEGAALKVSVDSAINGGWPWHWFLRHYRADFPDFSKISAPPLGSVAIVAARNDATARPYLEEYGPGYRIEMIVWFPERYRDLNPGRFFRRLADGETWRRAWRYFMYRDIELVESPGDVILYFPPDFEPPGLPAPEGR